MLIRRKNKIFILCQLVVLTCVISLLPAGCAGTGTALKRHQKKMGAVMGNEYHIPKRPVDRHYIGCAWSKQFGPIEDLYSAEIRIKKEE